MSDYDWGERGIDQDQGADPQGMIAEEYRYEESRRTGYWRTASGTIEPVHATPAVDQDHDTVDDRWDRLLRLILQYGTERFDAGLRAMQHPTVKVSMPGHPSDETLGKIIAELAMARRRAGDD